VTIDSCRGERHAHAGRFVRDLPSLVHRIQGTMRTSILFVDDDESILAALRRRLRSHSTWESTFAKSAAEALTALSNRAFDVVATDLHMPGGDGAALLAEVRKRWPNTFRVVLSGTCENTKILAAVRDAHYFLCKPFELETLQVALDRAMRNRKDLADPVLAGFASGVTNLPSLPAIYHRLSAAIEDDSLSVRDIGNLISEDVSLTGKLLRLVNSGFFGAPKHVGSPAEAAVLLGMEVLRAAVLGSSLYATIDPNLARESGLDELWDHSLKVARGTRVLAGVLHCEKLVADAAYQAAILHEVGRLVFLVNSPEAYLRYRREVAAVGIDTLETEVKHLGRAHETLGAYLLATWGLSDAVFQAVAQHRQPMATSKAVDALCLLHLADSLCAGLPDQAPGLNMHYLFELGLSDRLEEMAAALALSAPETVGRSA
jgi:HD-like signal output (HDOD) protein/CheY-like chemotaxis protein